MFKLRLWAAATLASLALGGAAHAQLPPVIAPPIPTGTLITCNVPSGSGYVPNSCSAEQIAALTQSSLTVTTTTGVFTSFGACGGVDDTAMLTAWTAAITAGSVASIPNTVCVFKSALTFPNGINGVTVQGAGPQSILRYSGASTTIPELITIGAVTSGTCQINLWNLRNFRLDSHTVMTAGDAMLIGHLCNGTIQSVYISTGIGASANSNFYNGMHFWAGNEIHLSDYNYRASNIGMILNGDLAGTTLVDLQMSQGVISYSTIGLDIAGDANPIISQTTFINNGTDVSIDQSQVAQTNRGIYFDGTDFIDETLGGAGIGISITDPGVSTESIALPGWIAGAVNQGVYIAPGVTAKIDVAGGYIFDNGGDGLQNNSTLANITIGSEFIGFNGGYGVNNTVSDPSMLLVGIGGAGTNTLGDVFGGSITSASSMGLQVLSSNGAGLVFQNSTNPGVSGNLLGVDNADGYNSTGTNKIFGTVNYFDNTATAGAEIGAIVWRTLHGGTLTNDFSTYNGNLYTGYPGTKIIDSSGDYFAPSGSAAAPSVSVGVANAGLYGDGTNVFVANGGVEVAEFFGNGPHFTKNGAGPVMGLDRQDATLSSPSTVSQILSTGFNSTGANLRTWTNIQSSARIATTSSEEAELIFQTFHGGALTSDFSIDNGSFYLGAFGTQLITPTGLVHMPQTVFASIGTTVPSPQVGDEIAITDASTCTANSQVTAGGGSTHSCATVYNGVGWFALVTH